ncbi:ribulokinase [Actinomyces slackii]|uniref:Ribulokinase n=1 Tax=Actinomyces slackii TaxID=52774 RepID=A0A3S4SMI7_9ACTO|nr:ribulokinase [Actinomyces slackii]VEG73439.1 Ribulokinase [Actinomyces slackii]
MDKDVSGPLQDTHVLGLDFGTLSVRAAVVRVRDGEVIAEAVSEYATPVMDRVLSAGDGRELPPDFALQVPGDYLEAGRRACSRAVSASAVEPGSIIGLGLDVTSSTVVVTDAQGTPMCEKEEFVNEPHAYVKLWKHHGAQEQVERIVALAEQRGEAWLPRYGGTLSSEMLLPKALETLEKAPELYARIEEILDMLDWLTWRLTGSLSYSAAASGYKHMLQDGAYPSPEFLGALNPDFADVYTTRMSHPIKPLGDRAGGLLAEWATAFGVPAGIPVAVGHIDAHVHAASVNAVRPGQMTGVAGTSTCWLLPSATLMEVPGVFGVVDGGICEGTWGYEAGQSAVGDSFAWFIDTCVPASYHRRAEQEGISIFDLLDRLAAAQEVGEHGLVALDWWNGNRSPLVDARLSGLMIGMTLSTRPEDQYRALLESTAFGARVIIENYEAHGVPVDEVRMAGGLIKNDFLMQMYADVTRRRLLTASTLQAGAHGSAVFAAVAAGAYPDLPAAAQAMGGVSRRVYEPDEAAAQRYDRLYAHYRHLHELFGRQDRIMHDLRDLRAQALSR